MAIIAVRLLVTPCWNNTTGQPSAGAAPALGTAASTGMRSRSSRGKGCGLAAVGGASCEFTQKLPRTSARSPK